MAEICTTLYFINSNILTVKCVFHLEISDWRLLVKRHRRSEIFDNINFVLSDRTVGSAARMRIPSHDVVFLSVGSAARMRIPSHDVVFLSIDETIQTKNYCTRAFPNENSRTVSPQKIDDTTTKTLALF